MIHKTPQLVKFKRLQQRLGVPLYQAIGVLEALWIVTQTNAPQGDVGRLSDEEIATLMEWDGESDDLITALVDTGWLDRDGDEHTPGKGWRLIVHDWADHCPKYLRANLIRWKKGFCLGQGTQGTLPKARYPKKGTTIGKVISKDITVPGSAPESRAGNGDTPGGGRGDGLTQNEMEREGIRRQLAKAGVRDAEEQERLIDAELEARAAK